MTIQDLDGASHETSRKRSLSGNRQFTTVVYPPDMYRKIKALARRNGVSVQDETLRLCAVALKTEDPSFSPPLAPHAQYLVDALTSDAERLGGDRKLRTVGHLLDAARMIRKLAAQIARLTA
jgi:hypothetical protein